LNTHVEKTGVTEFFVEDLAHQNSILKMEHLINGDQ